MLTWSKRVVFSAAGTAAAFIIVEVLLRLIVSKEDLLFSWERPGAPIAFDSTGALIGAPNARYFAQDGPYRAEYRTNSVGLREVHETSSSKAVGVRRYLAVGDSWIYGTSLTQGRAIPDRLEVRLSERLGVSVQVENAGAGGMSAFDMYMAFRRFAPNYSFDGVVIGLPHNENRESNLVDRRRAFIKTATPMPTNDWRLYLFVRRFLFRVRMPEVPVGVAGTSTNQDLVRGAISDVVRLVREARSAGLDVYFIDFPETWRVQGSGAPQMSMGQAWGQALDAEHVPHAGHALTERACWGFDDLVHPSEAGADAIASIAAQMVATGVGRSVRATEPRCVDAEGARPD